MQRIHLRDDNPAVCPAKPFTMTGIEGDPSVSATPPDQPQQTGKFATLTLDELLQIVDEGKDQNGNPLFDSDLDILQA